MNTCRELETGEATLFFNHTSVSVQVCFVQSLDFRFTPFIHLAQLTLNTYAPLRVGNIMKFPQVAFFVVGLPPQSQKQ